MNWRIYLSVFLYIGLLMAVPSPLLAEEPIDTGVSEVFELMPVEEAPMATTTEVEVMDAHSLLNGMELESTGSSNVLFLPGIKGSRLYDGNGNKLWEPFGDGDIEALMLNAAGKSVRGDVHTEPGDVVDTVAGFMDIYGSFMEFMDGLVEDDTINEWRAMDYDWRLSLPDIIGAGIEVTNPIPVSTYTQRYVETALRDLAYTSKSGKVTIVAHSNGGLVAKQLMSSMGADSVQYFIDKIIFIGVPQSGAPQALGALLYGYKEGLPWWFPSIVSTSAARTFAENSPMGYHLLPSDAYFSTVQDNYHPLVSFGSGTTHTKEREAYGNLINTSDELRRFALAEEGGRQKPLATRTDQANVLNEALLNYGQQVHTSIDAWKPPYGVEVHQVAGWGKDTVAGIEYYDLCVLTFCTQKYRPTFIEDGDGVVPVPSALMMSESEKVDRYWLNLKTPDYEIFGGHDHGDLLATQEIKDFILNRLINDSAPLPPLLSSSQPLTDEPARKLRFFLHSPLSLSITNSNGDRTGLGNDGELDAEIIGAEYGQLGEVQYILAPQNDRYKVELDGYEAGTFTLEIQEITAEEVSASITFANIPTSTTTVATIEIESLSDESNILLLDSDGDNTFETEIAAEINTVVSYESEAVVKENERQTSNKNQSRIITSPHANNLGDLQMRLCILLLQVLLEYLEDKANAELP